MKLWLLKPLKCCESSEHNPWQIPYDRVHRFLIKAANERDARELAAQNAGDEGESAWQLTHYSACNEVTLDGDAEVVMRMF